VRYEKSGRTDEFEEPNKRASKASRAKIRKCDAYLGAAPPRGLYPNRLKNFKSGGPIRHHERELETPNGKKVTIGRENRVKGNI
jgi:hypothetical protein